MIIHNLVRSVVRSLVREPCTLLRHASRTHSFLAPPFALARTAHAATVDTMSALLARASNTNKILHFYLVLINDLIQLGSSYTTNYMVLNIIVVAHLSAFKLFYIIRSECGSGGGGGGRGDEPCNLKKKHRNRNENLGKCKRNGKTHGPRRNEGAALAQPTSDVPT